MSVYDVVCVRSCLRVCVCMVCINANVPFDSRRSMEAQKFDDIPMSDDGSIRRMALRFDIANAHRERERTKRARTRCTLSSCVVSHRNGNWEWKIYMKRMRPIEKNAIRECPCPGMFCPMCVHSFLRILLMLRLINGNLIL